MKFIILSYILITAHLSLAGIHWLNEIDIFAKVKKICMTSMCNKLLINKSNDFYAISFFWTFNFFLSLYSNLNKVKGNQRNIIQRLSFLNIFLSYRNVLIFTKDNYYSNICLTSILPVWMFSSFQHKFKFDMCY